MFFEKQPKKIITYGVVDKIWEYKRKVMRSIPRTDPLLFFNSKIFTVLFKFLDFLQLLDRFKVLTWVVISEFYMTWRKNFTEIFTYRRGGRLSTPCLDGVDFAHAWTG